jgi:hypothetical protein
MRLHCAKIPEKIFKKLNTVKCSSERIQTMIMRKVVFGRRDQVMALKIIKNVDKYREAAKLEVRI